MFATAIAPFAMSPVNALAAPSPPRPEVRSGVAQYVRARAADAAGLSELAASGYSAALNAMPGDEVLALRAYRQAIDAGDRALAVRAARTLDAKGALPPDGRLVLLTEAVAASDWKAAGLAVDRIEEEGVFGFAVPVMRAWLARGSGQGDPLALVVDTRRAGSVASTYAAEHRALLQIAMGRNDDGIAAIRSLAGPGSGRGMRLRLAAAAKLAKSDKALALGLIEGDQSPLVVARSRIEAGKPLPGAVDSAAEGIAELFARIAVDINRERVTPIALTLARLSTWLAPRNSETWLVTAELLSASEQEDMAIAALAQVRADDPYAAAARDARVAALVKQGAQEAALTEALASASRAGATAADWSRVGELQSTLNRPADAAKSFTRALELSRAQGEDDGRWALLLRQGGALHEAGEWPAARKALREAAKLAPEQAVVLNYLGYAQLERREDLDEAQKLIESASRLRPDDPAITDSLGWLYFVRGQNDKAIEMLERAVIGEPGEATINEHLGDAYWTAGRKIDARYAWRAALVYAEQDAAARIGRKLDFGLTPELVSP